VHFEIGYRFEGNLSMLYLIEVKGMTEEEALSGKYLNETIADILYNRAIQN